MPSSPLFTYTNDQLVPFQAGDEVFMQPVRLAANTTFLKGTVLGEVGTNEVQRITVTGGPTGGSFTATVLGQTATIPYNATAAQVKALIGALSSVGVDNVLTSGGPLPGSTVDVTFINLLGDKDITTITVNNAGLTGGTSPAAAITTPTAGTGTGPGIYAAYASGNTDGTQNARAILPFDCITDANGKITLGTATGGDDRQRTYDTIPVYVSEAVFKTTDLVGFDATALAALGRLIAGTVANGLVRLT